MPTPNELAVTSVNQRFSAVLRFGFVLCLAALILAIPSAAQTVTDIYNFTGNPGDGFEPTVPMIVSPNGVFYGTTLSGGDFNCGYGGCGTVFQLTHSGSQWTHTTIYQFQGGTDGYQSYSNLTLDRAGRLYGVTFGGTPWNAVFRLTPGNPWQFALLYQFTGQSDGGYPLSPVFLDNKGAVYGATQEGGLHGKGCNQQFGCGAIFQLVPPSQPGGTWTEHTLYEFTGASDGGNPSTVIMDNTGTIYGTTTSGGTFNSSCPSGCGVVFKLTPNNGAWSYSVIYSFSGSPDNIPYGNLVLGPNGVLFGLVKRGYLGGGGAAIFLLAPPKGTGSWTLRDIYVTSGQSYPVTNLTIGPNAILCGDIYGDQDLDYGYVFQLVPPSQPGGQWTYTTLVDFNKVGPSQNPEGVLVSSGVLYVSLSGGTYWPGAIVSVVP
jgi:hypothetical protein